MKWVPEIIFRLLVPLLIWWAPFWGSVASIIADTTDVMVWDWMGVARLSEFYNQWDKLLDTYFYLVLGYVIWRKWTNTLAKRAAVGLLAWRVIGVVIYEFVIPARWLLFVFPNLFLTFAMVYMGWIKVTGKDPVKTKKRLIIFLLVLLVPKLYQEYLFHVAELNVFRWLQSLV